METCWEADAPYADLVSECKNLGLRIPSEREYQDHCAAANDAIEDWYDSEGHLTERGAFEDFITERYNLEDE